MKANEKFLFFEENIIALDDISNISIETIDGGYERCFYKLVFTLKTEKVVITSSRNEDFIKQAFKKVSKLLFELYLEPKEEKIKKSIPRNVSF